MAAPSQGLGASDGRFERLLAARKGKQGSDSSLEDDLRLSAQIGVGLLARSEELQERLEQADDRLAASSKQVAQLEKRLQRALSDLEASETLNGSLRSSLETDRKTIARLSAEHVKGAGSDAKLKKLAREREDLRQELEVETRRAAAAEARAKKATDRLAVLSDAKVDKARKDAEETRLRGSQRDQDALSKAKALMTLAASAPRSPKLGEADQEFPEVLALVHNLVLENDDLRYEISGLNELLASAREEQSGLRSELEARTAFLPEEATTANATLMSEALLSDSASERAFSPTFGESTNTTASSWAPSTSLANKRLSTMSASSASDGGMHTQMSQHLPDGSNAGRKRAPLRRVGPAPRLHGRRAQSVDMNALSSENEGDMPPFPRPLRAQGSRPHSRQESRPIVPPLSPLRDTVDPDMSSASEPLSPRSGPPSGLTMSSPARNRTLALAKPQTIDAAVQTGSQSINPPSALLPAFSIMAGASDGRSTPELPVSDGVSDHQHDARSASLMTLADHVTRLLGRIKSADIASLESRFKKQRLTGDVGHLSKSTLKELVRGHLRLQPQIDKATQFVDVQNLRDHFRKVLEQEARARAVASEHDSLVNKRDFVGLVQLMRDTLLELARLRGLVNRIQLEPYLAQRLAELDKADSADAGLAPLPSTGLLAPLARFFAPALPTVDASLPSAKPVVPRQEATAAIAPTLVNVQIGKSGAIRRAVSIAPQVENGDPGALRPLNKGLNGIFAGGNLGASRATAGASSDRWATKEDLPVRPPPGRLLERQLRPRGLSDSSIRTGFEGSSANPTNRLMTPATLASSGQPGPTVEGNVSAADNGASREAILSSLSARINSLRTSSPSTPPSLPVTKAGLGPSTEPLVIAHSAASNETVVKSESVSNAGLWNGLSAWAAKAAFTIPNEERVPQLKRSNI